jgi:hypothetical protein
MTVLRSESLVDQAVLLAVGTDGGRGRVLIQATRRRGSTAVAHSAVAVTQAANERLTDGLHPTAAARRTASCKGC